MARAQASRQAIAIGLSKARRAGVELPPPEEGPAPEKTREQAERELRNGKSATKPSGKRSRARKKALKAINGDLGAPKFRHYRLSGRKKMNSAEKTNTCAHPACDCAPVEGEYCSDYCENASGDVATSCRCGHPGCKGGAPLPE